ncbi:hypothetical protein JL09_g6861 [Pichia kudriavzevii]|uniref:Uncharacterized protein n=1 Tax=Pichia kudriavzevii TaxID=4909 RepID=A0A099NKT7_PICKU|nr:hypothetical protein JL09_g6861 [Pichia kudriavzevii]
MIHQAPQVWNLHHQSVHFVLSPNLDKQWNHAMNSNQPRTLPSLS